jgi:outer membrane protein assembly factor BamE (lipoprotein component of BamABCDE complex)
MTRLLRSSKFWLPNRALLVAISFMIASGVVSAQTARKPAGTEEEPVFHEYRGVKLGWLADEVRKKLGNPLNKSDDQDYYIFNNEKERAQVFYDKATRQVTAISIDFVSGATEVITPQQVFGGEVEARDDGSQSKLVRYPKAGCWVSYSRTAGDNPIITVTIQKMP